MMGCGAVKIIDIPKVHWCASTHPTVLRSQRTAGFDFLAYPQSAVGRGGVNPCLQHGLGACKASVNIDVSLSFGTHVRVASPAFGATATEVSHRGSGFDIYRLDVGEEQRQFFWKRKDGTPYGSIHALCRTLATEGRKLVFTINGGIYSEQFTPLGLYIENGKRYYRLTPGESKGNFFLLPNSVYYRGRDARRRDQGLSARAGLSTPSSQDPCW